MNEESLWFISENGEPISVFSDREQALEESFYLKEENPLERFDIYELSREDLEEYSEEWELARYSGFVTSDDDDYGKSAIG